MDALQTLDNNVDENIDNFEQHLNDIYDMELDDDTAFASSTEFLVESSNLFFFYPIYQPSVPSEQAINLSSASKRTADPHVAPPGSSKQARDIYFRSNLAPVSTITPYSSEDPITSIIVATYRSKVVIEDLQGNITVEQDSDGTDYYTTFPLYDGVDELIDAITDANDHLYTVPDIYTVYGDTQENTNFLNDLSVPHIMEPEHWDGYFTLNNPTLCILVQSVLHTCSKYNINADDIQDAMNYILLCIIKPSLVDYKSKSPYFG